MLILSALVVSSQTRRVCVNQNNCFNSPLKFYDSYLWDFGDGTTSTLENPCHVYAAVGNYTITIIGLENCGASDTALQNVTVICKPIAAFSASIYFGCAPLQVSFINQTSSPNPSTYVWNFGDGKPQNTQTNPIHTFSKPGTYNISLIATNNCGSDTISQKIIVLNKQKGSACTIFSGVFESGSSCGNIPLSNFKIVLLDTNNNIITSVLPVITKNDGTFSFTSDDLANINTKTRFSFATQNGLILEDVGYNTLEGWYQQQPIKLILLKVKGFIGADSIKCVSDSVHFMSNVIGGIFPYIYSWSFGDGNTSNLANAVVKYEAAGVYTASLVITDSLGCKNTTQETITIIDKPVTNFIASPTAGAQPLEVSFTNNTVGAGTINYFWDFGDSNTDTNANPTHVYQNEGIYNACLIASNQCGSNTSCITINVTTTYQITIGSPGDETNSYCMHTPDGGFIIAGTTKGASSGDDIFVIKTDDKMKIQWSKTFGGNNDDVLFDRDPIQPIGQIAKPVTATPDGGFLVLGHTSSFGQGFSDMYLLRLDQNGNLIWSRTYGTDKIERGISVNQFSNGDLLLSGDVEPGPFGGKDIYLVRTDANGSMQWTKRIGKSGHDQVFNTQIANDDGFICAGATTSVSGSFDAYVFKANSAGAIQMSSIYGDAANDSYQNILELNGGNGYIAVGYTQSFGAGMHDFLLSRLDNKGYVIWSKTYGGNSSDIGDRIIKTTDGGYAILGSTWSFGAGTTDVMLLKTDSLGNVQWSMAYGGSSLDFARSLDETNDGGYHICGFTGSFGAGDFDIYSIKTDAAGNSGCNETSITPLVSSPVITVQNFTPNVTSGGVQGTPDTKINAITFNVNTLCPSSARIQNTIHEPETLNLQPLPAISIYPNPSNGEMVISYFIPQNLTSSPNGGGKEGAAQLSIYDLAGRKLKSYPLFGETNQLSISEKDLHEGIYFYEVISNNKKIKQDKIVVIK